MAVPTTTIAGRGEMIFKQETTACAAIADPTTYWAATPKPLRAWDVDLSGLKYKSEKDPALRPFAWMRSAQIMMAKEQAIKAKCWLHGLNQTGAYGTAVTQDNFGMMLLSAMGGESLGTTRYCAAGSSPTVVKVDSATGLSAGQAVYINHEARQILSISGVDLTLDMALSASPSASDLCYASATYYLEADHLSNLADANHTTLACLYRGYAATDQWQMRGVVPEIELSDIAPGKPATVELNLLGQDWENVTGPSWGVAPTEAPPPVQVSSTAGLYYQTVGVTTKNFVHCRSLAIKLNQKRVALESPSGNQGIIGHACFGDAYPSIEWEDAFSVDYETAYEAQTNKFFGYQLGKSTTSLGAVLITGQCLYLEDSPHASSKNGERVVKPKFFASRHATAAYDPIRSPIAIHRFPKLAA